MGKVFSLRAGTELHHGTDAAANFHWPEGPAWFCLDREAAFAWAGWASPPEGQVRGEKRVLTFRLKRTVLLADVVLLSDWAALAERLCGEPEPNMWAFAAKVCEAGLPGWYGRREVMISRPRDLLARRRRPT